MLLQVCQFFLWFSVCAEAKGQFPRLIGSRSTDQILQSSEQMKLLSTKADLWVLYLSMGQLRREVSGSPMAHQAPVVHSTVHLRTSGRRWQGLYPGLVLEEEAALPMRP